MATTATLLWEIQRFPEHHSLAITFHDSHEERNKMIKHYQEVSDEYMRQYELFGDLFDQGEALNRSGAAPNPPAGLQGRCFLAYLLGRTGCTFYILPLNPS